MKLLALFVRLNAIITESVSAVSRFALILWYVAGRRTCAIVVVDAKCGWFLNFVNGIEFSYCWHGISPSKQELYSEHD